MMKAKHFLTGAVAVLLTVLLAFSVCSAQDVPVKEFSWDSWEADVSGSWYYDGPFVYDGKQHTITLQEGYDAYIVAPGISGNSAKDAGTYTAEVTFTCPEAPETDKTHTFTKEWKILKADWDETPAWQSGAPYVYDGEEKKVIVTGVPNGTAIDYTGNTATDAGSYTAKATVSHMNYNLPAVEDLNWKILKADWDETPAWQSGAPYVYDGEEKEVIVTGVPDGTAIDYTGNTATDAGNYTATATISHKNYNLPAVEDLTWEITQAEYDMSQVKWDYTGTPFVYDGQEKKVTLTGLPEGVTATVTGDTATDTGAYTAVAVLSTTDVNYNAPSVDPCSWVIVPGEYDMSQVKWDYTGTPFVYDGQEKKVTLTGLPEGVTATVTDGTATDAGAYTAVAVLSTTDVNYNAPSVDPCSWAIAQAEYDMGQVKWSYPGTPFPRDGKEKTVTLTGLPDGVTATYTGNTAAEAGTYTASATLSVSDPNYITPSVDPLIWEIIEKSQYDMGNVSWDYSGDPFVWDGTEKAVSLTGLPEGVTVAGIIKGRATEPGTYTAEAQLKWDTENYEEPTVMPLTWEICKAEYDMSGVKWDYSGTAFVYDGKEHTVALTGVPEGVEISYTGNTQSAAGEYAAEAAVSGWADPDHYRKPSFPEGFSGTLTWIIVNSADRKVLVHDISKKDFKADEKAKLLGAISDRDKKNEAPAIEFLFTEDMLLKPSYTPITNDTLHDPSYTFIPGDMLLKPSCSVMLNDMLLAASSIVGPDNMLLKSSYKLTVIQMDKSQNTDQKDKSGLYSDGLCLHLDKDRNDTKYGYLRLTSSSATELTLKKQ